MSETEANHGRLNCPFCGAPSARDMRWVSKGLYAICCSNCFSSSGDFASQELAVAAWNNRKPGLVDPAVTREDQWKLMSIAMMRRVPIYCNGGYLGVPLSMDVKYVRLSEHCGWYWNEGDDKPLSLQPPPRPKVEIGADELDRLRAGEAAARVAVDSQTDEAFDRLDMLLNPAEASQ